MPHGALLVLGAGATTIEAVSDSSTHILGLRPEQLIGRHLGDVMDRAAAADLVAVGASSVRPALPPFARRTGAGGSRIQE